MGRVDARLLTPACDPLACHIKTRAERVLTGCPGLGVERGNPELVRVGLSERLADGVLTPPPCPSNCLRLRANTPLNDRCEGSSVQRSSKSHRNVPRSSAALGFVTISEPSRAYTAGPAPPVRRVASPERQGCSVRVGNGYIPAGSDALITPVTPRSFIRTGRGSGSSGRPSCHQGLTTRVRGTSSDRNRPSDHLRDSPQLVLEPPAGMLDHWWTDAVRRCSAAWAGGPQVGLPPGRPWTPASPMWMPLRARSTAQPRARRRVAASGLGW